MLPSKGMAVVVAPPCPVLSPRLQAAGVWLDTFGQHDPIRSSSRAARLTETDPDRGILSAHLTIDQASAVSARFERRRTARLEKALTVLLPLLKQYRAATPPPCNTALVQAPDADHRRTTARWVRVSPVVDQGGGADRPEKYDPISGMFNSKFMNSRGITRAGCRNRTVASCLKLGGFLKFPDIHAAD